MSKFKTDEQYTHALKCAKASGNGRSIREAIVDMLRPEAHEVVLKAKKSMSTKNGYGVVMQFATSLGKYKNHFIDACVLEGFDYETAQVVKEIT